MSVSVKRPVLKLKKKPVDIFFELTALIALIFAWCYCFYHYSSLPEIIPTHYGIDGVVDDHGSKKTIFILPLILTVLIFILRIANKFPHKFNYPTAITHNNVEKQYTMATRMMRYLQFIEIGRAHV